MLQTISNNIKDELFEIISNKDDKLLSFKQHYMSDESFDIKIPKKLTTSTLQS